MPRYIDADALLSDIERTIEESGCVNHEGEIMDCVRYAPTIDAMPVVRGEWVKKHNDVCFWYECSVCGHTPPRDKWGHTWFSVCCPNCGAKMEGGTQ